MFSFSKVSNYLAVIISICVSLIFIEVILRFAWQNPYSNTSTDKILKLRIHHQNIDQTLKRDLIDDKIKSVHFRTDDRCYIKPSKRFSKPDFTVVFMGASTTECSAVQEDKRFHYLVSKNLEQRGLKVNTLNIARSGSTIHDCINVLFNHVVQDHPDVVVLMTATNDTGILKAYHNYTVRMPYEVCLKDTAKYSLQILSIHSSLFGFIREKITVRDPKTRPLENVKRDNAIIDPEPFEARLNVFITMCKSFKIEPVLVTEPFINSYRNILTPEWADNDNQKLFNQTIRKVSEKNNITLIDLSSYIFNKEQRYEQLQQVFYDGIHVTDYGSQLYASYISEKLYPLLKTKR